MRAELEQLQWSNIYLAERDVYPPSEATRLQLKAEMFLPETAI